MTAQVGSDIRALRKSRKLTLRDLSASIGRSVGWLSQIERAQSTPSIEDLALLAEKLGVNISFFFRSARRNPQEQGLVLRAADRFPIGTPEAGLVEELLSPSLSGSFEMIKSTFAPRSASHGGRAARPKEDGGVLISGRLSLKIGELQVELQPGDSFQFSEKAYSWRNDGDEPAIVIWVVSPPIY
jgi:transcriptional regulator with XRE-family HTH domain